MSYKSYKFYSSSEGVSLYLAVVIMSIFLAISLGLGTLLLRQLEMVRGTENSVIAFYAADTGIERALYEGGQGGSSYSGKLDNGSSYSVKFVKPNDDCKALNYCIKSVGFFKETKRAIEVKM